MLARDFAFDGAEVHSLLRRLDAPQTVKSVLFVIADLVGSGSLEVSRAGLARMMGVRSVRTADARIAASEGLRVLDVVRRPDPRGGDLVSVYRIRVDVLKAMMADAWAAIRGAMALALARKRQFQALRRVKTGGGANSAPNPWPAIPQQGQRKLFPSEAEISTARRMLSRPDCDSFDALDARDVLARAGLEC